MPTQFSVERSDCTNQAESDGETSTIKYSTPGFYSSLSCDGDNYLYKYKNALGQGEFKIPAHIFYDIPELATLLHIGSGNRIFETARIYERAPIATLFPDDRRK